MASELDFGRFVSIVRVDYHLHMFKRYLFRTLKLLFIALMFIILIAPEWPAFNEEEYQLRAIIGSRQFDFLVWELMAISTKAEAILANGHTYLDESTRKQIVLDYLTLTGEIARLEWQIEQIFADPTVPDPLGSSRNLQLEVSKKRESLTEMQSTAEAIMQDQVSDILAGAGFEVLGQAWPPVMMHMTPLPSILIVSPRDRIERLYGIPLVHGLSTPAKEVMESTIFHQLNLSALVVPIGGLGIYPAMILETSNVNRLAEVTAHEWAHHWLAPYPISLYYGIDSQVRTMNETVASIVGTEVGANVIARYYPEFMPSPPVEVPPPVESAPSAATEFDFLAEMAESRAQVNAFLADGLIEEAEDYMESRRRLFVENGFEIRKLNQAYFAFFGAYADEPGAAGDDPIGPMLLKLREKSGSLRHFMEIMAPISSYEELRSILDQMQNEASYPQD